MRKTVGKSPNAEESARALVFRLLGNVAVGEAIEVGRSDTTLVAPWSHEPMQGQGMRLGKVQKAHIVAIATHVRGSKAKKRLVVNKAWQMIQKAQSARRVTAADHPEVYKALHARQACEYPDGDDLRKLLLQKYKFLTIGAGLEIRASEAHQCNGLFSTKPIGKSQLITFYDGVAVALTQSQLQKHKERSGWFICVGRSSKTSPVIVGFTSSDAIPRNAGVMSLTNSAKPPHANCKRDDLANQTYRHGDAFLSSLICLRAVRDIRAGEELTWNYNVR